MGPLDAYPNLGAPDWKKAKSYPEGLKRLAPTGDTFCNLGQSRRANNWTALFRTSSFMR
jgi:hypothetical protein